MSGIRINPVTPHPAGIALRQRRRLRRLAYALLATLLLLGSFAAICTADSAGLAQEIATAEARLDDLLIRYTEKHPDVVAARAALDDMRAARERGAAEGEPAAAGLGSPPTGVAPATRDNGASPPLVPQAIARERREARLVSTFADICATPGVLACFDFDGETPYTSTVSSVTGGLSSSADGRVRARRYAGPETRGGAAVRMDFAAADAADHGAFEVTLDAFGEGDRLSVQWRQWFSRELVTRFAKDGSRIVPAVGGDGAKQLGITEIGDARGCSFGEVVAGNAYWAGAMSVYHGCGLWFRPKTPAPIGPADPSDYDFQPGGDNVCRYRYFRNALSPGVDYLYPTVPANLLEVPGLGAIVDTQRYHGCLGWLARQWMTFRLEIDIAYCRTSWSSADVPVACADTPGRLRYWVKYADERRPWLVIDYRMPLRWRAEHSGRYGRFMFVPYNTGEQARSDKPPAYTLYDDIVIARNVDVLPWPEK